MTLLMRGKWLIAATTAVVFTATAAYTFRAPQVYESTALVRIDTKGMSGSHSFLDDMAGTSKITNEIETLKSYSIAEAVSRAFFKKSYLDGEDSVVIPVLREVDEELLGNVPAIQQVALLVGRRVEFSPVRESDIIKISARSTSPRESALLANTFAKVFSEQNLNTSRTRFRAVREFLESQVQTKYRSLDTAEASLQAYMRTSGMFSLDIEANRVIEQLSQLEASRDVIDIEMGSRKRTLSSYKRELGTLEPNVARSIEEYGDAYIRLLQDQLAKLEIQRDVIIAQNPSLSGESIYSQKLTEIDGQIGTLSKNLQDKTRSFLSSLIPGGSRTSPAEGNTGFLASLKQKVIEQQIELDGFEAKKAALNSVISDYERQFNQIPQRSIELAKLQRARLSNEKLYLMVEEKFNEAAITESSELGYVLIVDPARIPLNPVSPKVMLNLMLGCLLGLGMGVGAVVLRARLDTRVRSPEDLRRHGHVVLSTVGLIRLHGGNGRALRNSRARGATLNAHLVAYRYPRSSFAESYRHLRTRVRSVCSCRFMKTVLVTSPNPREGKSTTVCNLAVAFAEGRARTLLVDADIWRPSIHAVFRLKGNPGFTDLLLGKATLDECRHVNVLQNLDIICSGTPAENPASLFVPRNIENLLARAGEEYEFILLDSPPLLAVSDASMLSALVDGTVVVVHAGKTQMNSLEGGLEYIERIGGHVLGIVLNAYNARKVYNASNGADGCGYYAYRYGSQNSANG